MVKNSLVYSVVIVYMFFLWLFLVVFYMTIVRKKQLHGQCRETFMSLMIKMVTNLL